MKFQELKEATYHGDVYIEEWGDDGQAIYRMSQKDANRLKYLAELELEAEDTRNSPDGYTNAERKVFKEIEEIFERATIITVDAVFDWHNFEFKKT